MVMMMDDDDDDGDDDLFEHRPYEYSEYILVVSYVLFS